MPGGSERFGSLSLQRIHPDCAARSEGAQIGPLKQAAQKQKIQVAKAMCSPVLQRGRATLVQVCTLSFISFLCPHPQPTAMSNKCLASHTVHQGAQTDGLTQTHFNGRILKGCLVGHIKKKNQKMSQTFRFLSYFLLL